MTNKSVSGMPVLLNNLGQATEPQDFKNGNNNSLQGGYENENYAL